MRISNIQNFAANAANMIDKCCGPRKSANNTTSQNSLERSPAMDTVSFGVFDKKYADETQIYAAGLLLKDWEAYRALNCSTYLSIKPTEETLNDPPKNIYEMNIVTYSTFRPEASKETVEDYDKTIKNIISDFNEIFTYKSGWEKKLHTREDFIKAAKLANFVEQRGYIPRDNEDEDDWMKKQYGLDY